MVFDLFFSILDKRDGDEMGARTGAGERSTFKKIWVDVNGIGKDGRRDDNRSKTCCP